MKKTIITVVTGLMLGVSATAMAAPTHHLDSHGPQYHHNDRGNHYGQHINFKRGERLPAAYHYSRYNFSDWKRARLQAPPRGYHWMKVNNRFVLVDSGYRVYRVM